MRTEARVFSLGALVGVTVTTNLLVWKTCEINQATGYWYLESKMSWAGQTSNPLAYLAPLVVLAWGFVIWMLFAKLRRDREKLVPTVLFGIVVGITITLSGFFSLFMALSSRNQMTNEVAFLFATMATIGLPAGVLFGGCIWFVYWQLLQHSPALNRIPSQVAFPILIVICGNAVWQLFPHVPDSFIPDRWAHEIEDRELMLPDLSRQHPFKGENIQDIEKLLGNSEVPDSSESGSSTAVANYYLGPNRMMQVAYERSTGNILNWSINEKFFRLSSESFRQEPPPKAFDSEGQVIDWSKTELTKCPVFSLEIGGRRYDTLISLMGKVDREVADRVPRYGFGATTLLNGEIFLCGGMDTSETESKLLDDSLILSPNGHVERGPKLPVPLLRPSLITLKNGKVLVVGGTADHARVSPACYLYDPQSNGLEGVGNLLLPRRDTSLGELNNGDVVVVSGETEHGLSDQNGLTNTVELIRFSPQGVRHLMLGSLKVARTLPTVIPVSTDEALIVSGELGLDHGFRNYAGADHFVGFTEPLPTPADTKQTERPR